MTKRFGVYYYVMAATAVALSGIGFGPADAQQQRGFDKPAQMLKLCNSTSSGDGQTLCPADAGTQVFVLDLHTLSQFDKLRRRLPELAPGIPEHCGGLDEPLPRPFEKVTFRGDSVVLEVPLDTSCLSTPEPDPGDIDPAADARPPVIACRTDGAGARVTYTARGAATPPAAPTRPAADENSLSCFRTPPSLAVGPRVYPRPDSEFTYEIDLSPDCIIDPTSEACEVTFAPQGGDIDPLPELDGVLSRRRTVERLTAQSDADRALIEVDCNMIPGLCPYDWTALDVSSFEFEGDAELTEEEVLAVCRDITYDCGVSSDAAVPTDEDMTMCAQISPYACGKEVDACFDSYNPGGCQIHKKPDDSSGYELCLSFEYEVLDYCLKSSYQNGGSCQAHCNVKDENGAAVHGGALREMLFRRCLSENTFYAENCK